MTDALRNSQPEASTIITFLIKLLTSFLFNYTDWVFFLIIFKKAVQWREMSFLVKYRMSTFFHVDPKIRKMIKFLGGFILWSKNGCLVQQENRKEFRVCFILKKKHDVTTAAKEEKSVSGSRKLLLMTMMM